MLGVEMRDRVVEEREASGVVAEQASDERTWVRRLGANQLLPERLRVGVPPGTTTRPA